MANTYSLNGELRKSTDTVSSRVIRTFSQSVRSDEEFSVSLSVPSGTVDAELLFTGIDPAKFLLITTTKKVEIKFHPAGTTIYTAADLVGVMIYPMAVLFGDFKKLFYSNTSGETSILTVMAVGEDPGCM